MQREPLTAAYHLAVAANTSGTRRTTDKTRPPQTRSAFGGVPGAVVLTIGMPLIVGYLLYASRYTGGSMLAFSAVSFDRFAHELVPGWRDVAFYTGWLMLQAVFQLVLPGRTVAGSELPDGRRLRYKTNGLASFATTLALAALLQATGALPLSFIYDHLVPIMSVAAMFAVAFSMFLYPYGRATDPHHLTNQPICDFFLGTGHNPRVPPRGVFDLKFFCESRPGLILWALIDASFAQAELRLHGHISAAMVLVCAFQFAYVLDYFVHEPALLTTMDIRDENFGFMLAFGDLVWVPAAFSLQGAYLVGHARPLATWAIVAIVACELLGYYVFRAANLQKHRFRRGPEDAKTWGRKARYLSTEDGSALLVSGFWGWSRHFNYVGDITMAVAWSLPCLFGSPLPYFYPLYLTGLLVHRERRDNARCARKYGPVWDEYCANVRWRIVPLVY